MANIPTWDKQKKENMEEIGHIEQTEQRGHIEQMEINRKNEFRTNTANRSHRANRTSRRNWGTNKQ